MKLIAFSGKKQSGKDSACRFLKANADILFPHTWQDGYGERAPRRTKVETFYVGGPMKEFAKTFGVPHELVWGDDNMKNTLTDILWETLPQYERLVDEARRRGFQSCSPDEDLSHLSVPGLVYKFRDRPDILGAALDRAESKVPKGRMTAREFLQQIGEDMFLPMKASYWVDQFKAAVRASKADVGLVADPRKPEQIAAIKELGGITIRLTRDPYEGKDQHISETALDPDKFDWANFDEIIDNRGMTVAETNGEALARLIRRGWVTTKDTSFINLDPQEAVAA
jgi:hypothetical protein